MEQQQPTFAAPLSVLVPLRGGEITVDSAPMGRLLAAKALLMPVLQRLIEQVPDLLDSGRIERIKATRELEADDIAELCLLLDAADVLLGFVATLAPLPKEQAQQLMPDEFAFLFAVVVQVNWDFFVRALPVLKAAAQRLQSLGTSSSLRPATG